MRFKLRPIPRRLRYRARLRGSLELIMLFNSFVQDTGVRI